MFDERDALKQAFEKIEPDAALKTRIIKRMEDKKMKQFTKISVKGILIAACIALAGITSAFAMSPAGQKAINSILAYFQNSKATELTSLAELAKYNEEIGEGVTKDGYTLTLDNVAADDNFIHVFYTVTSDSEPFYAGDGALVDSTFPQMAVSVVINGELAGTGNNHNSYDSYFADAHTYKTVCKYNIAALNIPDKFDVELFGGLITKNGTPKDEPEVFKKLYSRRSYGTITAEDRASVWYVCANVDKSSVKVETVTREIHTELPWLDATVEKAVFSPFGNQLVLSAKAGDGSESAARIDLFALFDGNGTCLDLLNTDLVGGVEGVSINSVEFLKAGKDTKQLKFVPLKFKEHTDRNSVVQKIGTYPLTYPVSDYGSVVVTNIRITDGEIAIDYYKDGFVLYDPGFVLTDGNGNNAEPGGKLGCVLYTDTHYDTDSYTARYVYDAYDGNGQKLPPDESVSAENLKKNFTTLGVNSQSNMELEFSRAVTVDLK